MKSEYLGINIKYIYFASFNFRTGSSHQHGPPSLPSGPSSLSAPPLPPLPTSGAVPSPNLVPNSNTDTSLKQRAVAKFKMFNFHLNWDLHMTQCKPCG